MFYEDMKKLTIQDKVEEKRRRRRSLIRFIHQVKDITNLSDPYHEDCREREAWLL